MALTKKEKNNLLGELNRYSTALFYIVTAENRKIKSNIDLRDIQDIIFKDNMEQVNLVFPKLISKIDPKDIDIAWEMYSKEFTKKSCVDQVLFKERGRYIHLQEIRDIALTDELADKYIKDATYKEAINLNYTKAILDIIGKNLKNKYLSTKEALKEYIEIFEEMKQELDKKICRDINQYYINQITN